jgi:tetraacyldisaccharide 4'-kinase
MSATRHLTKLSWPLLLPLAWGYGTGVWTRNMFYANGWFGVRHAHRPVISIGNLVAGGTGKTPLTLRLARELGQFARVGILSRGYRGEAEHREQPTLVSRGAGPLCSWQEAGDEPFLLARRLSNAIVVAGRLRWKGAEMAIQEGADLLLLDDGLQHRSLARNLELIVVDGRDPFGGRAYLPLGRLRESPHALARADLVVVMRMPEDPPLLERQLRALTDAPIVWMEPRIERVRFIDDREVGELAGKRVGLFCGIAKPDAFVETVRKLGCQVVAMRAVGDHRAISDEQLLSLAETCRSRGGELLLCTEKDYVKLKSIANLSLPIAVVRIVVTIVANGEAWQHFIEECHHLLPRHS